MKQWELLGEARTPEGNLMTLTRRGREYLILADGKPLMGSNMKGSEEALATFGCTRARALEAPCVLVGGLGMGFTLAATIATLPPDATVVVAELMPAVLSTSSTPETGTLMGIPRRQAVLRRADADMLQQLVLSRPGHLSLRGAADELVEAGVTDDAEIVRVLGP